MTGKVDILKSELRARLPEKLPLRLGVAVSGGSDSVALMHLLHDLAQAEKIELHVATVNHCLRPEASDEAIQAASQAAGLGLSHETLVWRGWDGQGNLQDQARQARYALLTEWARRKGIPAIALGHTADDQAETVLMRLGRAAGVTGLSGMPAARDFNGVTLLRPILGITRQELRDYLSETGVNWIDDPSNHDTRFDRIKAREALSGLDSLGITPQSLSRVAENLAQAGEALGRYTQESALKTAVIDGGDVCVDRFAFSALPKEIHRRLLIGIIGWIAGPGYPPRGSAVDQAIAAVSNAQALALAGCLLVPKGDKTWVCRELKAVESKTAIPQDLWDNRWVLSGPTTAGLQVHALGEAGLRQVSEWRALGKPRQVLLSQPAVWDGDMLVSAPLAGFSNGWSAKLAPEWPEFYSSLLSH